MGVILAFGKNLSNQTSGNITDQITIVGLNTTVTNSTIAVN